MTKRAKISTPRRHSLSIATKGAEIHFELEQSGRSFEVLSISVADAPDLRVGFDPAGADEVLDETSDARQVFNIATRIRLDGCVLCNQEMRAPDIETLRSVLARAKFRFWNPEEI